MRPQKRSIPDQAVRYAIRYLLQLPSLYRPRDNTPHVFLFSTRRSGSTLLQNMIYAHPGFNYIDQPFDYWKFNPYRRYLPKSLGPHLVSLTDEEKSLVKLYFNKLLMRKAVLSSQWNWLGASHHFVWSRYVVKILVAKAQIEWFERCFNARIVYSTRHPVATALSIMELGWPSYIDCYIKNGEYVTQNLSDRMYDISIEISRKGSNLEKFILNWCLENLVPLRLWRFKDWTTISFERAVNDPSSVARRLSRDLDLGDLKSMIRAANRPTRTTLRSSRKVIVSQGPKVRSSAWLKKVSKDDLRKVAQILDTFEIDLYRSDEPYANPEFDQ